uniref:Uncharacterized protein n=1 Tax=Acrobeloides nanus TaxID=290746 RepID=A0A914EN16_9BILA
MKFLNFFLLRLQGYFVGHFVPCGRTRSSQLQLQVSLIINTTDQRIYGSVDHQNHTYSASGSVYLNLWNKDDDDGKYCNDTQSSCAYSYEEGAPFYASIFNNDGFFRLITQSNIQNDKFVLKNAVGRCINDPAQSLHWYPDKVSNVSWCVCCDDYESGGDLACPVNPWQPKEVNSA